MQAHTNFDMPFGNIKLTFIPFLKTYRHSNLNCHQTNPNPYPNLKLSSHPKTFLFTFWRSAFYPQRKCKPPQYDCNKMYVPTRWVQNAYSETNALTHAHTQKLITFLCLAD